MDVPIATRQALVWALIVVGVLVIHRSPAFAHPGRTDASGCHTCRTNCSKWGLRTGQYHCHGGGRATTRKPPPPPPPPSPPTAPVRVFRNDELSSTTTLPENSIVVRSPRPLAQAQEFRVEVAAIVDGDTFVVRWAESLYLVKLRDVEAPELEQPYGQAARDRLVALLMGRLITIWPRKGSDCIILARAEVDGQSLAEMLLIEGFVWAAPDAPAAWRRLEALARRKEAGFWRGERPEPPWEYRVQRTMAGKLEHP